MAKSWGGAIAEAAEKSKGLRPESEKKAGRNNSSITAIHPELHDWAEETDYLLGRAEDLARTEIETDQWKALDYMADIEKTIKILRAMLKLKHSK